MKATTNKIAVFVAILFLFSCKSMEVTPGSERVRVLDAEPKGCLYVGEVSSVQEDKTVGTLETEMDLATRVDLRNKAHALGGNILVFLKGKNTNTLPGSATAVPLVMKAGSTAGKSGATGAAAKTAETAPKDTAESEAEKESTLVFLATVFKCPSSVLNQ
ncbi:DUF4156 domain-containing protein [bacterium]|nr:DUF4156 domain-containing protein [bacterium]